MTTDTHATIAEPPVPPGEEPPKLPPHELRATQRQTLETPRRRYGPPARLLFKSMDVVYGRQRSLSKFKVLEIIARVPYQAWENVAYVAVTHRYSKPRFARRIFERVRESRAQQDNEQWHLLILEELIEEEGKREGFLRYGLLPQVIAFAYYQLSWLLFTVRPTWSYGLNVDFEDHAEHEYALYVQENPWLEERPYDGLFAEEYGRFDTLADLFRQIGHDERVHKLESLARIEQARFQ
jgi:ubiquinol oxidase